MKTLITAAFALSLLGGTSALADPHDNHQGGDHQRGDHGSQAHDNNGRNDQAPRARGDGEKAGHDDHAPRPGKPADPQGPVNVPVAATPHPGKPTPPAVLPARPGQPPSSGRPGDWRGDRGGPGGRPRTPPANAGGSWTGGGRDHDGPGRDHQAGDHDGRDQDGRNHDQNWRDHDGRPGRDWRDHNGDGRNHDWRNNNWRQRDNDWRPPTNWNGRHGWLDPRRYQRERWAQHRYNWRPYYQPYGWYARTWNYGDFLPWAWFGDDYYITDYYQFGLAPPPYGYVWVRVGDDALLIDRYTGQVVAVEHDLFY